MQIVTGKQVGAGTRANAYVMLVGDKGKTGKLSLRGWFDFLNPISSDTYDNLVVVSDNDLGNVLVVVVGCDGSWFEDQWYVSSVSVADVQTKDVGQFPCYHWIGGDDSVTITAKTSEFCMVAMQMILSSACTGCMYRTLAKISPPFSARTLGIIGDWAYNRERRVLTRIYAHPRPQIEAY